MRCLGILLIGFVAASITPASFAFSADYFLTIAGGYSPQGNQASLEANVLFFQRLLSNKQLSNATHKVYFADGFDGGHDLQVLRRKVQAAVIEKWPELEDPKSWLNAEVLKLENQAAFLAELEKIDGYAESLKSIEDRAKAREASVEAELRQVKFRRLIQQLENVVLGQNIAVVADAEVFERYRKVVTAEEGFLGP